MSDLKLTLGLVNDPALSTREPEASYDLLPRRPVRGWLALFASCQIAVGVLGVLGAARASLLASQLRDSLSPQSYWVLVSTLILSVCVWVLYTYAGIGLCAKWGNCVRLARLGLTLSLVYFVITFLAGPLVVTLNSRRPNESYSVLANSQPRYVYEFPYYEALPHHWKAYAWLFSEVLWCVVWLAYFRKSLRVQSTYGNVDYTVPLYGS